MIAFLKVEECPEISILYLHSVLEMFTKSSLVAALAVQTCVAAVSKARDDDGSCTKTTVAIL